MNKLVFVDMDGTLSVPQYQAPDGRMVIGFADADWLEYCREHGAASYEFCRPVPCTARYVRAMKAAGARLFVLSSVMSDDEAEAKTVFAKRHFPDVFEAFCYVREDAQKITEICRIAQESGVPAGDCILVEDSYGTLLLAAAQGIEPLHLSMLAESDTLRQATGHV